MCFVCEPLCDVVWFGGVLSLCMFVRAERVCFVCD